MLEVRNLKSVPADRIIYCTMEVDNCDKLLPETLPLSHCTDFVSNGRWADGRCPSSRVALKVGVESVPCTGGAAPDGI